MIPPSPKKLICPRCNYQAVWVAESDMMIKHIDTTCPKCHSNCNISYEVNAKRSGTRWLIFEKLPIFFY